MRPVLVINSGSSSLKYQLVGIPSAGDPTRFARGIAERIGESKSRIVHTAAGADPVTIDGGLPDHETALAAVLDALATHGPGLGGLLGVGHRVVHGGQRFTAPTLVTDEVVDAIAALAPLAPLHNPANVAGLRALRQQLPDLPHVAVFDTAFHATLPAAAATYALPRDLVERYALRRYGFHGTSHAHVTRQAAHLLGLPLQDVNLVVCHIGNGVSMAAVQAGRSVDTSMGLTPLEGLVMGTRSGDIDPAIVFHLARHAGMSLDEIDIMLNRRSGLRGMCGQSDVRSVHELADAGDDSAVLALEVYAYRIRKYIGAYLAVVPGVHAVVFTAGVGENDPDLRAAVCRPLGHLGLHLDESANAAAQRATLGGGRQVDDGSGPLRVLVVATDEEAEIAAQTALLAAQTRRA